LFGLSAGSAWADRPSAGIEAGVSFSRISPANTGQSIRMNPGLLAGVYVIVPFLKTISIQAELVYAQKYSRLSTTTGSTTTTEDLRLDYIEIPVLAKLAFLKGSYIVEGASFAFPVRARLQPASGPVRDIKRQTTSPDIGLVIGGGVPIGRLAIEGRYDGGFRKIDAAADGAIQRNRSFSLLTRMRF
jgi:hypothetical protein